MAEGLIHLAALALTKMYFAEEKQDREIPSSVLKIQSILIHKGMNSGRSGWISCFSLTSALKDLALFSKNYESILMDGFSPELDLVRRYERRVSQEFSRLVISEVRDYCRRTVEFCRLFDIPVGPEHEDLLTYKFGLLCLQGKAAAAMKQSVNVLYCDHMRVERPVLDSGLPLGDLFPRSMESHFARMKFSSKNVNRHLKMRNITCAWSLLQGLKKALLPVRPSKMAEQLESHARVLSRERTTEVDMDRVERIVDSVCAEFGLNNNQDYLSVRGIGTKATVQSSCAQMGNLGYLTPYHHLRRDKPARWASYFLSVGSQFLGYVNRGPVPVPVYGMGVDDCELVQDMFEDNVDTETENNFNFLIQRSEAIPAMILEPMKVRIITKPSTLEYLPLQCLQKKLASTIYSHPSKTFCLTGETISEEMIAGFVADSAWQPGDLWISGDYTAATDNLLTFTPKLFVKRIWGNHFLKNPEVWARIEESLFNTRVDYDVDLPREDQWKAAADDLLKKDLKVQDKHTRADAVREGWLSQVDLPESIDQISGQLMGNVLSFPLLCLTNLVAFWYAYELYRGKAVRFNELPPVRINGDDIGFKANPQFYKIWLESVELFGLKPSIGKNFASDSFFTINSCLYRVNSTIVSNDDQFRRYNTVTKVPYVNMGLICNRRKNDCSRDYSIKRVSHVLNQDSSIPEVVDRLASAPRILQTLFEGLDQRIVKNVKDLYWEHSQYFRNQFPGLPWKHLINFKAEEFENLENLFKSIVPPNPQGVESEANLRSQQKLITVEWEESDIRNQYWDLMKRCKKISWERLLSRARPVKTSVSGLLQGRRGRWVDHYEHTVSFREWQSTATFLTEGEFV